MHAPAGSFRGHVVAVVLAVLVAVAFLAVLLRTGGVWGSGESYRIDALVPSAQGVYPGATVRIAGLRVGSVADVRVRGRRALLTLGLRKRYAPIRRDARVEVRLRTIAGEGYVELHPGSANAPAVAGGGVLSLRQAIEPVQIDQVLSVLDRGTRERARQMFRGLENGVGGQGARLNAFLGGLSDTVQRGTPVARVLATDRARVARLVGGLGTITAAIGRRGADIRLASRQGRAVAESLAARDAAMRDLLAQLPSTLTQVRRTSTLLRGVTRVAGPVVGDTATAVRGLAPTMRLLRPATTDARVAAGELGRTAAPLEGALAGIRRVAPGLDKALPQLRSAFCRLDPLAKYVEPYTREVGVHLANLASGANFYDATGHAARIHAVFSESAPVAYDPKTSAAVNKLLTAGILGRVKALGWDPYPKPGGIADTQTGRGDTGPADSHLAYPRLSGAC
jgi:phospholipid/cholesterol/gamma-HCH transport system substrate-binding protein